MGKGKGKKGGKGKGKHKTPAPTVRNAFEFSRKFISPGASLKSIAADHRPEKFS